MKPISTALFSFMSLFALTSAHAAGEEIHSRRTILVTYFDPIGTTLSNSSESVAKLLQSNAAIDAEIILCRLPVVYDQAGDAAKKCFESISPRPIYTFSLGEAGCSLEFETAAHNRDFSGLSDNQKNRRNYRVIDPNGPVSDSTTFPIDKLLCDSELDESEKNWAKLSPSAGGYVCNNVAYTLGRYFKREHPSTRFGFVHVPMDTCEVPKTDKGYASTSEFAAGILGRYIQAALKNDEQVSDEVREKGIFRPEVFPRTLKNLDHTILTLKTSDTCRLDYLSKMRSLRKEFLEEEIADTVEYQNDKRGYLPPRKTVIVDAEMEQTRFRLRLEMQKTFRSPVIPQLVEIRSVKKRIQSE